MAHQMAAAICDEAMTSQTGIGLPRLPEPKTAFTEAVQADVDREVARKSADKRKKILEEAEIAVRQTKAALSALDKQDRAHALKALVDVIDKLEFILIRNPNLTLAAMDVHTVVHDLYAFTTTIEDLIGEALRALKHGEVQIARHSLAGLASEIIVTTTHIPLGTYMQAIMAIVPLVENDKIYEAKAALQGTLGTLVQADEIIALPLLRARFILRQAESLVEKEQRSEQENWQLSELLGEVRNQLEIAKLLGYGKKKDFEPIYQQIKQIDERSRGGKSGTGWFDKVKGQISEVF